jgi:glyoxylase I family protein
MIRGLEHVGIASPDPERLTQWYVERLGFVVNYHNPVSKTSFVKAPDGSMLEIISSDGERGPGATKTPGLRHLAIEVDDFQQDYARLKASGVEFMTEPAVSGGNSVVFFKDPDGNILHLIQRTTPLG